MRIQTISAFELHSNTCILQLHLVDFFFFFRDVAFIFQQTWKQSCEDVRFCLSERHSSSSSGPHGNGSDLSLNMSPDASTRPSLESPAAK